MRALVIGTGSIGKKHISAISSLVPDVEYILYRQSVYEDELSRSINAQVTKSLDEAIDLSPDFSLIATPTGVHLKPLELLLKHKVPLYVEKPIVSTELEVRKLREIISEIDTLPITQSGYMLRHLASLRKLRQIIQSGELGNIVRATLEVGQWLPDWRPDQKYQESYSARSDLGGGVIMDLSHELDMARYLFGEFEHIKVMAGQFSSLNIKSEDTASIMLGNKKGPIVTINLDYVARNLRRKYTIIGDKATVEWDLTKKLIVLESCMGSDPVKCEEKDFNVACAFKSAWKDFLDAINEKSKTYQDLRDALISTELAINCRDQALL